MGDPTTTVMDLDNSMRMPDQCMECRGKEQLTTKLPMCHPLLRTCVCEPFQVFRRGVCEWEDSRPYVVSTFERGRWAIVVSPEGTEYVKNVDVDASGASSSSASAGGGGRGDSGVIDLRYIWVPEQTGEQAQEARAVESFLSEIQYYQDSPHPDQYGTHVAEHDKTGKLASADGSAAEGAAAPGGSSEDGDARAISAPSVRHRISIRFCVEDPSSEPVDAPPITIEIFDEVPWIDASNEQQGLLSTAAYLVPPCKSHDAGFRMPIDTVASIDIEVGRVPVEGRALPPSGLSLRSRIRSRVGEDGTIHWYLPHLGMNSLYVRMHCPVEMPSGCSMPPLRSVMTVSRSSTG